MVRAIHKNYTDRWRPWVLLGLILLLVATVRVRVRDMPLERDEGEYAYAGQLMLQGVAPYTEACNMKLPGTYAAYALIMVVFGQTPAGIHIGVMLVNLGSIVLVFLLGRKLLDNTTGVVAALAFALMSLSPYVLGLAGHATHFVTLFALAGILLLLKVTGSKTETGKRRLEIAEADASDTERQGPALEVDTNNAIRESPITNPRFFLFLSGLLFGLSFLMKQHGVFFAMFGLVYLAWTEIGPRLAKRTGRASTPDSQSPAPENRTAPLGYSFFAFIWGLLLPYGLTCLTLWLWGALPGFWFWTVTYAAQYASATPTVYAADMLRRGVGAVVGPNICLWLLPLFGAVMMWWDQRLKDGMGDDDRGGGRAAGQLRASSRSRRLPRIRASQPESQVRNPRFFVTLFALCSLGSVSIGFYFREHYFITLLPALGLLSGMATSRAIYLLRTDKTLELFLAIPVLLMLVAGVGAALLGNSSFWFNLSPAEVVKNSYSSSIFCDTARMAAYLRTNASPKSRIAVLGSEPEIFFNSRLRSVSGSIYMYPLMEHHPYAGKMQETMISEIEQSRPEYAVFVQDRLSWLMQRNSEQRLLTWWQSYWPSNLEVVLTIPIQGKSDILNPDKSKPVDPTATPAPDTGQSYLLLLKRKPQESTFRPK